MKVLVVGSGGREHSLCWKLKQSKKLTKLWCAPGNPGIAKVAELLPLKVDQLDELVQFSKKERVDLVVVGPEYPLTLGLADLLRREGIRVFGPSKAAAAIEGSKSFSKEIMNAARVPTARSVVVTSRKEAEKTIAEWGAPLVLKADGLAAGKGVYVCSTLEEATAALDPLFNELKTDKLLIEEFLLGVEVSFIVATNGETVLPCSSSHDYKRIFDDDKGLNTGGMGTVSPSPRFEDSQSEWAVAHVIRPVLKELEKRGAPFCGFLYAGLMISKDGKVNVLEFNARMGDPECQSVMRRLESDLLPILFALSDPTRKEMVPTPIWKGESAVTVVLAAEGYPQQIRTDDPISGIEKAEAIPGVVVFHAGTKNGKGGEVLTAGGRVLNVTGVGSSLGEARATAYRGVECIQWKGRQHRKDIGLR